MPLGRRYRYSLLVLTAALILGVGVLAALNLSYLRTLQSRSLHESARQAVVELGTQITRHLAAQPAPLGTGHESQRWSDYDRLVRSLHRVEPSLQYVTVTEDDVIVYHRDTSGLSSNAPVVPDTDGVPVQVGRRLLALGGGTVPILTFSVRIPAEPGPARRVQVAMRREAVTQREEQAARVLGIMFRLSVVTLGLAFVLALLLTVWIVRHELERERRRRDEEHLAFAGLLADGIIHDVRNPMSALNLDLQMLEMETVRGEGLRPARLRELAGRARETMARMDLVMREFLYVSRPASTTLEAVDVNACVKDSLDLLGPRFEREDLRLAVDLAAAPLFTRGHSVGLKRAVINILMNAKQASPKGGVVRVATRAANGAVLVEVEDQGPGIPPAVKSRIFEMFVTGRPDGIGLGLYLAKAAVEAGGGMIAAENRPEGGARFTIRLPAE
jgi:signal transduction histidine kinase